MNLARDDVPEEVSRALGGLPVRWAPANAAAGDYDGRDRTLEVFLADAAEQREILGILRPERPRLEAAAGGAIIIVFHTRAETRRLYPEMDVAMAMLKGVRIDVKQGPWAVRVRSLDQARAGALEIAAAEVSASLMKPAA